MTKVELNEVLENHKHWLRRDCDGWEYLKADLQHVDLQYIDLRHVDLRHADLRHANLQDTNLQYANLKYANLRYTNLKYADLQDADLKDADLQGTDLRRADLRGTDLQDADLKNTILQYADLRGAKNVPFIPMVCPEKGSFIGFKKARGYIVELEILADAKRSSATSRKCRCDKAKVLSITNLDGSDAEITQIASSSDRKFIYKVGGIVSVDDFDEDRWNECSSGIHFFINRQEAVEYGV